MGFVFRKSSSVTERGSALFEPCSPVIVITCNKIDNDKIDTVISDGDDRGSGFLDVRKGYVDIKVLDKNLLHARH